MAEHELGDNYVIEEDSNDDLVIRDTTNGDVLKYDRSADAISALKSVQSLSADDLDIGSSDFVDAGDNFGTDGMSGVGSEFTTSSDSYNNIDPVWITQWDKFAPANATTAVVFTGRVEPGSTSVDIRVQNITDSETVIEKTGISSITNFVESNTDYTPTTTSGVIRFLIEFRNGDNSTSVTLEDPRAAVVVNT